MKAASPIIPSTYSTSSVWLMFKLAMALEQAKILSPNILEAIIHLNPPYVYDKSHRKDFLWPDPWGYEALWLPADARRRKPGKSRINTSG